MCSFLSVSIHCIGMHSTPQSLGLVSRYDLYGFESDKLAPRLFPCLTHPICKLGICFLDPKKLSSLFQVFLWRCLDLLLCPFRARLGLVTLGPKNSEFIELTYCFITASFVAAASSWDTKDRPAASSWDTNDRPGSWDTRLRHSSVAINASSPNPLL